MYFRALFVFSILTVTSCVNAQVVNLLTENFNSGFPVSWTRINQDGLTPHPSVSFVNDAWVAYEDVDSTGTGDSVAVATSYYSPAGIANDWMISPAIVLKNHGNFLSWQVKSQDPSYPDGYDVYVTNTAPVTDSFKVEGRRFFQTDYELPDWTDRQVSLDTFAGQTVYIAFRAKSDDQFLLLVDNIRVYADTTLSVNENQDNETIAAWPNPANEVVNVSGTSVIQHLALIDLSGKVLARYTPMSNRFTVPLQAVDKGLYLLQVMDVKGRHRQIKVMKQ